MVEEVLVREGLSTQHISCGKELLGRVERAGIKIVAAYWIRDRIAEISSWRLAIVTPEVDKQGPLKIYGKIHEVVLEPTPISCGLDTNMIEVLGLNYSFYKALKSAVRSGKELSDVRLSQFVVGDSLFDMYIYTLPATEHSK